ncbi:hypothetical protein ACSBR2_007015 [Camellia fascicularis]
MESSLTGPLPVNLGLNSPLQWLDVFSNSLSGDIPASLQNFIASNNDLRGNIPDQFQDCPSLSVLDLSSNHFSGKIPQSIASYERLVNLNLGNNQFTGEIPRPIAALPMLAILDLSNNSLTGTIPENFGSLPALEMLNLSYNKLEGPVPNNGILTTINPNDLIGNVGLCGGNGILPLCSQSFFTTASWQRKRKIHIINQVIVGFAAGISVILSLGLTLFVGKKLYKRCYGRCELAYLHHDCNPSVIHRDVKSNNILLDADFEARIADFGLARTMVQKNETVSMVAGFYGYIAPEYGYTLKVDEKCDDLPHIIFYI